MPIGAGIAAAGIGGSVISGAMAPDAPDPEALAAAQGKMNIDLAREQSRLAMTGQDTPFGSLQFVADPSSPSGYRAISELSPEQQALLMQSQNNQANLGDLTGTQLGRVGDTIGTPFNFDAARATQLSDISRKLMDPMWAEREDAMKNDMLNRGIRDGSAAFQTADRSFGDQRNRAYDQMFLDSWDKTNQAALTERNMPMMDLAALRGTPSPFSPQAIGQVGTPSPTIGQPNLMQASMDAYKIDSANNNAMMGGLMGIPSAMIGAYGRNPNMFGGSGSTGPGGWVTNTTFA